VSAAVVVALRGKTLTLARLAAERDSRRSQLPLALGFGCRYPDMTRGNGTLACKEPA